MVFDTEDSTGLQRRVDTLQGLIRVAALHPIVEIAEGDNQVCRSRRRHFIVAFSEPGEGDRAVAIFLLFDFSPPRGRGGVLFLALAFDGYGRIVMARPFE